MKKISLFFHNMNIVSKSILYNKVIKIFSKMLFFFIEFHYYYLSQNKLMMIFRKFQNLTIIY